MQNSNIEEKLINLSDRLKFTNGKKQYGYLHPQLKGMVDEIVDELAKDERVEKAYKLWYEMRNEVLHSYMDKELVSKIMNIFEETDKVIVKQYPTFKDFINGEMDKECNSAYFRAQESLKEAQLNNPIDQMTLSNYF